MPLFDKYPTGIGNGSDVIGKYLCEQVRIEARAFLLELFGRETNNLFVVDGSTATEKNPTLTILAMAWRASDYLADQLRKGNL